MTKPVIFTHHALQRIKERHVNEETATEMFYFGQPWYPTNSKYRFLSVKQSFQEYQRKSTSLYRKYDDIIFAYQETPGIYRVLTVMRENRKPNKTSRNRYL